MKKIYVVLLSVFLACNAAFAQNASARVDALRDYFEDFELEPIISFQPENDLIAFVDPASETPDDVLYQISFMLTAFEFFLEDFELEIEDLSVDTIVYRWVIIMDELKPIDHPDQMPIDIIIDTYWLGEFFGSRRNERNTMILEAMTEAVDQLDKQLEQQGPQSLQTPRQKR